MPGHMLHSISEGTTLPSFSSTLSSSNTVLCQAFHVPWYASSLSSMGYVLSGIDTEKCVGKAERSGQFLLWSPQPGWTDSASVSLGHKMLTVCAQYSSFIQFRHQINPCRPPAPLNSGLGSLQSVGSLCFLQIKSFPLLENSLYSSPGMLGKATWNLALGQSGLLWCGN